MNNSTGNHGLLTPKKSGVIVRHRIKSRSLNLLALTVKVRGAAIITGMYSWELGAVNTKTLSVFIGRRHFDFSIRALKTNLTRRTWVSFYRMTSIKY